VINKFTKDDEDQASDVFYSMDDKVKINVGESYRAVGSSGRGRRGIMPTDLKTIARDHDFNIVSLPPSVTLRVDVKLDEEEDGKTSYFKGVILMLLMPILLSYCIALNCK
jgi:hypothetical protein